MSLFSFFFSKKKIQTEAGKLFAFESAGIKCFCWSWRDSFRKCEMRILWCSVVGWASLWQRECTLHRFISCNAIYLFYFIYFSCFVFLDSRSHISLELAILNDYTRAARLIFIFRCQFNFSRSYRCPCIFSFIFVAFAPLAWLFKHIHLSAWISTIYFYVTYYSLAECICYVSAFAHDQAWICCVCVCVLCRVVCVYAAADFYGSQKSQNYLCDLKTSIETIYLYAHIYIL